MPQEVLEVLREGEQRRRVGQTDWNERSSRSHCVFIVVSRTANTIRLTREPHLGLIAQTIESMSKYEDGSARTSKLARLLLSADRLRESLTNIAGVHVLRI